MKKISFLLVYLLTSVIVCAQHKKISGTITGTQNETIIGATVLEKGTTNGVVTDIDGKFSIQLTNDNATLVISYIGYKTQEIKPQGNTLSIQMDEVSEQLNEVIVIGYGTTTVKSNTGSISSVKADDIMNYPSANFANSLAGKATGIQVIQSSGTPGSAPQIRVRGIGTLTAGSNPLIVVDGFPLSEGSTINSINPNSIESIEILKDAASTAIYGSRGANGIIMITTKSGRNGKPSVTVSASYGVQTRSDRVKLVDAYDYAQFLKEARNTGYVNKDPQNRSESDNNTVRKQKGASKRELIPDYIVPYLNGEQGLTNTDWYEELVNYLRNQGKSVNTAGYIRKKLMDRDQHYVHVVSHRGDWKQFPENSLDAINSIIQMGGDVVEIDVQRTKDGQLILMHDERLDRTTNGKGLIAETTFADIQKLFLKDHNGNVTQHKVPTLKEVLLMSKGRIMLNLDKADRFFEQVVALLQETGTTDIAILKGLQSIEEINNRLGVHLDSIIFMPMVRMDNDDAEQRITSFVNEMAPVVFEVGYQKSDNPLPLKAKKLVARKSLLWYNSLKGRNGNHDDVVSKADPDAGYGYLIDKLGARMIQTDEPARLIEYLRSRDLH